MVNTALAPGRISEEPRNTSLLVLENVIRTCNLEDEFVYREIVEQVQAYSSVFGNIISTLVNWSRKGYEEARFVIAVLFKTNVEAAAARDAWQGRLFRSRNVTSSVVGSDAFLPDVSQNFIN